MLCDSGIDERGRVGERGEANNVNECLLLPAIGLLPGLWLGVTSDDAVRLNRRE